jgi:hypothetical protein
MMALLPFLSNLLVTLSCVREEAAAAIAASAVAAGENED